MTMLTKIAKTCLLSALLSTTAMVPTGALAQMATKAPPVADDQYAPWWFHGTVEVGGRDFVNDPQSNGIKAINNGKSLAGYYEYSDIKPGAFGNFDLSAGSQDGLYRIDAGGKNVGYNDESFYFDWSKAGEQYFNFYWDQSPHLYSMSAQTPFVLNGNVLTLVPGAAVLPVPTATAALTAAGIAGVYGPFALPVTIGIDRDTAAASYRWTPTDAWDINLDYSHMYRHGTQVSGEAEGVATNNIQVTKPVDDTTQNYDAVGQYLGTSPWGQRLVIQAGYEGSQYQDKYTDFLVQAVSGKIAAGGPVGTPTAAFAAISTWPSNRADAFTSSASADLPWNSRYTGTLNYTVMRQDAAFPPPGDYSNINAGTFNAFATFAGCAVAYCGPGNLDGQIDTLLSNNVVTTKIDPTLTAKTSFRYYDFDNQTPSYNLTGMPNGIAPVNTLTMGYEKINAGEELNWRPNKYWNLGAAYGFERYDWTRADANATNQNGAKVFADYMPFTWLTSRASAEYTDRRYDDYNYSANVGLFQWGPALGGGYASAYRQFMYDNRETWNAHYALDVAVIRSVTVTPWLKYQDQRYGVDPSNQYGLEDSNQFNAGVDGTWVASPELSFTAGYSWADIHQTAYGPVCNGPDPLPAACSISAHGAAAQNLNNYTIDTADRQTQNFVTAGVKYTPTDQIDLSLHYTGSLAADNMQELPPTPASNGSAAPAGLPIYAANGQFPENKVWFERLDAVGIYKFSPEQVAALGWKGQLKVRLAYTWERNSESNWANDFLTPYIGAGVGAAVGYGSQQDLWLAWYNPNYNVQMISGSLIASW
jgi:MtrB/PioB family decaheme-associated outer membrane protein